MYRCENMFEMKISAACLDDTYGCHIGDVIRYEIRCIYGGDNFVQHLDCLNAPTPSEIHYYGLLETVAMWANQFLVRASEQVFYNAVTKTDRNNVINYIDQHM